MKSVLQTPYSIDLGNGFTKRTADGKNVKVEPSLYARQRRGFQLKKVDNVIEVYDRKIHIGNEAIQSGQKTLSAVGDMDRYSSKAFKELLFGFIAKDFKQDIEIPLITLGLPESHYESLKDELKEVARDRVMVGVDGEKYDINIKQVEVYPQPVGTYVYLMRKEYDLEDARVLVVDGGYGTLDVTSMVGLNRTDWAGERLGMSEPYAQIKSVIDSKYGSLGLSIHQIGEALQEGIRVAGKKIPIIDLPEVEDILEDHYEEVIAFIKENYILDQFDYVVFTGGLALAYKKHFQGNNFIVLEEAQQANCLGFYDIGKAVLEDEAPSEDS